MPKCDNCDKIITKKSPILECNMCSKIIHANQACSNLSSKQLSALRNADNLGWSCEECRKESPRRKSFTILEEEEEDEDETAVCQDSESGSNSIKKFLSDISREVKKAVKKEIAFVNETLSVYCDKMDGIIKTLEMYSSKIKELENKNTYLTNQNKHLEIKVDAMEQYVATIEQSQLNNIVEIAGVPETKQGTQQDIALKLAAKLNMESKHITLVKRLKGRHGKEGVIQISLNQEDQVEQWIRAARKEKITAEDVASYAEPVTDSKVVVRRALSSANKTLLWQTKLKLKETYKYIWFQGGRVLVRKQDNDKPIVIRSKADIEKIGSKDNTFR